MQGGASPATSHACFARPRVQPPGFRPSPARCACLQRDANYCIRLPRWVRIRRYNGTGGHLQHTEGLYEIHYCRVHSNQVEKVVTKGEARIVSAVSQVEISSRVGQPRGRARVHAPRHYAIELAGAGVKTVQNNSRSRQTGPINSTIHHSHHTLLCDTQNTSSTSQFYHKQYACTLKQLLLVYRAASLKLRPPWRPKPTLPMDPTRPASLPT